MSRHLPRSSAGVTVIRCSGLILALSLGYGCSLTGSSYVTAEHADTLRLLTYNIHHGEGMDEVIDLDRIAELVRRTDADLVTLQEVDSVVDRTGRVDQAQVLAGLDTTSSVS